MTQLLETTSSIVSYVNMPRELPLAWREQAFSLLSRHFAGVSREQFDHDLSEKNAVLSLCDASTHALVGFSTMLVYETRFQGNPLSVVCSGDTIMDPSAWNTAALPREWIAAVNRLRADFPNGPMYWLLITSGFRTYRLLSTFWRHFFPRFDTTPSAYERELRDHLAAGHFGARYDANAGIVRFDQPQRLRSHLAGIPSARIESDPDVAFFARVNPGHAQGDELVCVCELNEYNLTRAGRRMVFGPRK
jgi:hypothetical protein